MDVKLKVVKELRINVIRIKLVRIIIEAEVLKYILFLNEGFGVYGFIVKLFLDLENL